MEEFLAYRIINKKMAFEQVPEILKEEVKKILIKEGYENLLK